ncbi:uncharacterized protein LOC115959266 isoform X2 [Quercus lobata]|uniref:uncharacterized protein LOC115959266 isoform X2 n=1 Tax=Quercus lobata TaxID=97700 RepID=UPI0012491F69|nr:uncharacterized protein LOC115959266 isoform X2 [Quercus lobata]
MGFRSWRRLRTPIGKVGSWKCSPKRCASVTESTTKDGQANNFGEVDIDGSLVASHSSVSEDIITVNKIDLVSEAELEVLTKKIKHINGIAQIKLAKFGSVDMDFVLGVGGYDPEGLLSNLFLPVILQYLTLKLT